MKIIDGCTKDQAFYALDHGLKAWYATIMNLGHPLRLSDNRNEILMKSGERIPMTRIGRLACEQEQDDSAETGETSGIVGECPRCSDLRTEVERLRAKTMTAVDDLPNNLKVHTKSPAMARLEHIIDELIKKIIFKCPTCLTALKEAAIWKQDYEGAAEYRKLLDALEKP